MSEQQRLFEHYNPLEDRVGKEFFDELPKRAGVYKMYNRKKKLLYVGKAKNLRNRLFTYRRAKVGKVSRKTIRLIRMTHDIKIELCDSEKDALLLENELIRNHKPEFNYAKKQPETYYYIALNRGENKLELSLQMYIPEKDYVFGAFKGHRLVRKTMGGLLRLLYMLDHEVGSIFDLPNVLSRKLTPMKYTLLWNMDEPISKKLYPELIDYFTGCDDILMKSLLEECRQRNLLERFAGTKILDDMESMKWFYERCSHRNFEIKQKLDLDSVLIPQEKLDDYFIEWAFGIDG